MNKYNAKEMKRLMGKAIHKHAMIEDGDHILVSVSGGKDSISLLWLLRERIKRIPIEYRITAVHVDPGFGSDSAVRLGEFFREHGFDHEIITTDFGPKAHSPENRENPCFLCSRLRRKAVFKLAARLNCNKIAFGHHRDDLIETFFLNIFYGASTSTMMPVQTFFGGRLTVIRPFYMIPERTIQKYAKGMERPDITLGCPTAGNSKRAEIKKMLRRLYKTNGKIEGNIFHAIQNVRPEYLPKG
jgi:tRNA 2-thiocytidine biosynthesis protein TtcA